MTGCADVVRSVLGACNQRDWLAIADACAPNVSSMIALAAGENTSEEYVRYWQGFCRAMTNQVISEIDIIGSGDFAVATMTCTGRDHDGPEWQQTESG